MANTNNEVSKDLVKVSLYLKINYVDSFFCDEIEIPANEYADYKKTLDAEEFDEDALEAEIKITDRILEAFGIDYGGDDTYSDQQFGIYVPDSFQKLKKAYLGKKWTLGKLPKDNNGWIKYSFKIAYCGKYDATVVIPVQVDGKDIVTDIQEPEAFLIAKGIKHQVVPDYIGIYDGMNNAIGCGVNVMYELERMRKVVLEDDQLFFENLIRNGMTLDEAADEYKRLYGH